MVSWERKASGLKTPLSLFLEEQGTEYSVVDIEENEPILEEHGKMRAYLLFTYDPIRNVEVFYIEFDNGCLHESEKHNDDVEEYILVISGELQLVLSGKEIAVRQKQAIRFKADIPHAYHNPYGEICTVYNIIFYSVH